MAEGPCGIYPLTPHVPDHLSYKSAPSHLGNLGLLTLLQTPQAATCLRAFASALPSDGLTAFTSTSCTPLLKSPLLKEPHLALGSSPRATGNELAQTIGLK